MPKTESTKAVAARRRNRKRKRRVASSSSSSASISSDSSDGQVALKIKRPIENPPSSSSSDSSSPTSDSESSRDDHGEMPHAPALSTQEQASSSRGAPSSVQQTPRRSPSVTPPPAPIPSFLPSKISPTAGSSDDKKEQELKDRFKKFWMASVADGFKDDLDQIRKVLFCHSRNLLSHELRLLF
jgi:ribosome assembly protein 3